MENLKQLSREELISNLWLTDELINEIEIIDKEIEKKNILLKATVEEAQGEYLKSIENEYSHSDDYKVNKEYQRLTERLRKIHTIFIVIDVVFAILMGYLLIYLGMTFLQVVIFWLVIPTTFYFIYRGVQKYYLKRWKAETPLRSIEEILDEARNSQDFHQIPDSLLAKHIKHEITKLKQQQDEGRKVLASKTILPPGYQLRAREVVWYLENMRADNLKEAISALEEADYREKMERMIEIQSNEIRLLRDRIGKLVEESAEIRKWQEERINQENKKKKERI